MLSEARSALSSAGRGRPAGRTRPARRVLPWVEGAALLVALVVPFALSERTDLVTLATNVLILASSFHLSWTSSSDGPAQTAATEISGTLACAHGQSG